MGRNLTTLPISASFQYLTQISGSSLTDGTGSLITDLDINAATATSASHALASDTAISASYATTASFALNVTTPDLQVVTDEGAITTNDITAPTFIGDLIGNANTATSASHALVADLATTATSADTATSASHALVADTALTALTATSASWADNAGSALTADTATSASHALASDTAISASYATTASFALNVPTIDSGSFMITGSVTDDTLTFTKGDTSTFDLVVNNVVNATSASYAVSSSQAENANTAVSASHALVADSAITATSATTATSASFVSVVSSSQSFNYPILGGTGGGFREPAASHNITVNPGTGTLTAPFFSGDGSGLTGVGAFPYTGSADISGSIDLVGDLIIGLDTNSTFLNGRNFVGGNGNTISSTETAFPNTNIGGESNEITSGGLNMMLGGSDNQITSGYRNVIINGWGLGTTGITNGNHHTIIGANSPTINSAGQTCMILGGANHSMPNGNRSIIIGGQQTTGGATDTVVVGGVQNVLSGANRGGIFAGANNNLSAGNSSGMVIIGGQSHTTSVNGATNSALIGGNSNTFRNFWGSIGDATTGYARESYAFMGGGVDNQIGAASGGTGANGLPVVIGGLSNRIGATTDNSTGVFTAYSTILNSSGSIVDSGSFQGVIGGYENSVSGSNNAYIIASNNSVIDGHTNSTIIGGSGLATTKDDEVVVPNISINGQATGNIEGITIASTTGSMDVSTGNFFTLNLAAGVDTHLDATNITATAGQTITLFLRQDVTTAGTISFSPDFLFEGGTPFTASTGLAAKDVLTFVSDGTNMFATGLKNFS